MGVPLIIINQLNISIMKKFLMLLSVVALTATYSVAQNASSGVTITNNQGVLGFGGSDCDGNFILATLVTSNLVSKSNGFKKYTATYNAQDFCNQPAQPVTGIVPPFITQFLGFDSMEFTRTPGGTIHLIGRSAATKP
jgi:hypothetical protein